MDRNVFVKAYVRAPLVGPNRLGIIERLICRRVALNWNKEKEIVLEDGTAYKTTVGNEVTQEILMHAMAAGAITAAEFSNPVTIDWDKLIEFISKLLPLIIEFIKALILIFGL